MTKHRGKHLLCQKQERTVRGQLCHDPSHKAHQQRQPDSDVAYALPGAYFHREKSSVQVDLDKLKENRAVHQKAGEKTY